jgi:spermidine/putrescine-binding protein
MKKALDGHAGLGNVRRHWASGCAKKPSAHVTVLLGKECYRTRFLEGFHEGNGIKIKYSNFDCDETRLAKLTPRQGRDYDLSLPTTNIIVTDHRREGLVQSLDNVKVSPTSEHQPITRAVLRSQ